MMFKLTTPSITLALMSLSAFYSVALSAPGNISPSDERSAKMALTGKADLFTAEGLEQTRIQLRDVARRLCSQVADELDLSHHENYVRCVDKAVSDALASAPLRAARVDLSDLDLHRDSGVQAAKDRVKDMARALCRQHREPGDSSYARNLNTCVSQSFQSAWLRTTLSNDKTAWVVVKN
jgi:UrcA family protein